MDIEKGKEIFYRYKGCTMYIERDLGNEYQKCRVPKEIENEWKKEIAESLYCDAKIKSGHDRVEAINSYIVLLNTNEAVSFLLKIINDAQMDTFSKIIICETLKQYLKYNIDHKLKLQIANVLHRIKEEIIQQEITIDESYKKLSYMKDYDFSFANIKKRVERL